jgi:peptidyl-prolyl cis-trans isomerase A (cyclophilin A)
MLFASASLATLLALGALSPAEATAAEADERPQVVFDTTAGPITLELDRARAPITVDNFLRYVDSGFYDGLVFHRVIPGFMIQGGGMNEKMEEKTQGALPPIQNEARNGLSNIRGTICMARTSDPNSATSQFFINLVNNAAALDPNRGSAGYAVFGKVISGMDAVDSIATVQTGRRGPHDDVPLKPIFIKSARRKPKS